MNELIKIENSLCSFNGDEGNCNKFKNRKF